MSEHEDYDAKLRPRFYLIGLIIAFLEEFITQGVLKRNLVVWIIPTIIGFLPFLIAASLIHRSLLKRFGEHRAVLAYYLVAGGMGLMVEWFIIGLSPWSSPGADPFLMLVFQLGIFSFWGTVAVAPRVLLDKRRLVAGVRKWYKRFLTLGFALIYFVTLSSARQAQFVAGVGSVLVVFLLLNSFYFRYIRILNPSSVAKT